MLPIIPNSVSNIFFTFSLILFTNVYGQSLSLDLSFDTDGILVTPLGNGDDYGRSVVQQSDGKIVVAGYSNNGINQDYAIVRYLQDGTLDSTFDLDGKLTTAIGTGDDYSHSVAIQNDGKIVVAGLSKYGNFFKITVARYLPDGNLDTTFDTDGKITTIIGTKDDIGNSIALQTDGKIVVAGASSNGTNYDFALVRYNTDGSLDSTFDSDGKLTTPIGSSTDYAYTMALQADGKIIVGGYSNSATDSDFALARYNSDGSLDITFDSDGKLTTDLGNYEFGRSLVLLTDGKILLSGYHYNGIDYDFALVRYNLDGSLDTTFDNDGKLTTDFSNSTDYCYSVTLKSDGKIILAGASGPANNQDFALARYNSDGSLDSTFDLDGKITTSLGNGHEVCNSVILQGDGKIVAAGYSNNGTNQDFALVRYNNSITTDISEDGRLHKGLEIFPNPFSSCAKIQLNIMLKNCEMIIYNESGQEMRVMKNISGQSIVLNRSNLPIGYYIIKLIENGKIILSDKFEIIN